MYQTPLIIYLFFLTGTSKSKAECKSIYIYWNWNGQQHRRSLQPTARAQFMRGLNQSDDLSQDSTVSSSKRSSVVLEASDNMDMDGEKQPSAEATNPDQAVEIDLSNTVLDLTSFQLHDLDSVEFPTNLTELDLTANRLTSLDSRISHLSNLKKLALRQNLIDDAAIEPISRWATLAGLEVFLSS